MKKSLSIALLPILLLFVASGCETSTPHQLPQVAVFATNQPDQPRIEHALRQQFSAQDAIGVVVDLPRGCGYGERTSTITVKELAGDQTIATWTRAMRETQRFVFPLPNPGPGRYQIDLTYQEADSPRATETFLVR